MNSPDLLLIFPSYQCCHRSLPARHCRRISSSFRWILLGWWCVVALRWVLNRAMFFQSLYRCFGKWLVDIDRIFVYFNWRYLNLNVIHDSRYYLLLLLLYPFICIGIFEESIWFQHTSFWVRILDRLGYTEATLKHEGTCPPCRAMWPVTV